MTDAVRVRLIGKSDCHLCDDARAVIAAVCADTGTQWEEVSISDDPELADEYWDRIPVTMVDGEIHDIYRADAKRLRAALTSV